MRSSTHILQPPSQIRTRATDHASLPTAQILQPFKRARSVKCPAGSREYTLAGGIRGYAGDMDPREIEQAVFVPLRARVLRMARALLVLTLPLWLIFLPLETGSAWVMAELASVLVYIAAFHLDARLQGRVLVATLLVLSAVGLLHFGPTIGTGLFMMACILVSAFFFELRGVLLTVLLLTLLLSAAAPLALSGTLVPVSFEPDRATWLRMSATTLVALAAMSFAFVFVFAQLRKSLRAELEARRDAQAAHAERERTLQGIEVSQRLENIGRLAAAGAHDINNALGVIQGCADLLGISPDALERKQLLHEITLGVGRAAATAKQLLSFSREESQPPSSCEPARHLRDVAQSLTRFLPRDIALGVETSPTGWIDLSPGTFEQVLLNLILNARDALPNGGRIQLSCAEEGGSTVITVADTGVGISPEVQLRMFEPFFTTKGRAGTGLGLASVQTSNCVSEYERRVASTRPTSRKCHVVYSPSERWYSL